MHGRASAFALDSLAADRFRAYSVMMSGNGKLQSETRARQGFPIGLHAAIPRENRGGRKGDPMLKSLGFTVVPRNSFHSAGRTISITDVDDPEESTRSEVRSFANLIAGESGNYYRTSRSLRNKFRQPR